MLKRPHRKLLDKKSFIHLFIVSFWTFSFAVEVPIDDFSIETYTQSVDHYLLVDSPDYALPLLTPEYQALQLQRFYRHYYASDSQGLSPWSEEMVKTVLPVVQKVQYEILANFNHQHKPGSERHYGANFKEQSERWLEAIMRNMNVPQLDKIPFKMENRAISVNNTFARTLPDEAPDFFHFSLPGRGFPFDNLQASAIWAGTPLYILAVSQDKAWSLVLTPDAYFAWVKSNDIAYASKRFVRQWQSAVRKGLAAITETGASIVDRQQHFQFKGYIGAVFPFVHSDETTLSILIPIKNEKQKAVIKIGVVNQKSASMMPLIASKKNMARLMKQLQNRPYGWGGAFFFNDCSMEMKSLFAPFGIWLPRNTAQQAQLSSTLDLSENIVDKRLSILQEKGEPLLTLIYISGHVMLYVGNQKIDGSKMAAISYQNVWGLSPKNRSKRYVIGQSLFIPLLKDYPQKPDIHSPANGAYFKLIYLNKLEAETLSPQAFTARFILIKVHPSLKTKIQSSVP